MRPLFKLIAPTGQFPEFLTPNLEESGLEPAVAQLIETPADIIRGQLEPWLPSEVEPWMTDFWPAARGLGARSATPYGRSTTKCWPCRRPRRSNVSPRIWRSGRGPC
jgi:hypothetical protein